MWAFHKAQYETWEYDEENKKRCTNPPHKSLENRISTRLHPRSARVWETSVAETPWGGSQSHPQMALQQLRTHEAPLDLPVQLGHLKMELQTANASVTRSSDSILTQLPTMSPGWAGSSRATWGRPSLPLLYTFLLKPTTCTAKFAHQKRVRTWEGFFK